jgi:hypothetical protein
MRFAPFFLLPSILTLAPLASAQAPSFDARTWRPSTDPSAGLVLEPATTPGAGAWNVGAWADYALRPVTLSSGSGPSVTPVSHALGLDLTLGLGIGSRAAIGLDVPMALYQTGDRPLPTSLVGSGETPSTAIGDLGVHGKVTIVDDSGGGFGLAGLATVTVPTGERGSFYGEGAVTAGARLLAEYTLIVASAQASLGYTARPTQRTWPDPGGIVFGDTIPWSVGMSLRPDVLKIDPGHRQRWDVALHGWLPATPVGPFGSGDPGSAKESPMAVALSDRIELGHYRDAYALAGVELGITDAIGLPSFRGVLAIGWAPRDHDADGDGVPDDVDQCPELAEDKDGYEDNDGCPELDNDDDGVLDKDDACPNVAGSPSDDPKTNGCPQPDRDKDGVPDNVDACPDEKGMESDDPATNGCPTSKDRDKDGVSDKADKCPDQPEDKDGFEDEDGCPDPDDDGDGIADAQDACPREAGEPSTDPKLNGCPNPDRDGDTYENAVDKCPEEPETFNGVADDDGCPDTGGKPLAVLTMAKDGEHAKIAIAANDPLDPSGTTLRAIALEVHRSLPRDQWILYVAINDKKKPERSNVVTEALNRFVGRGTDFALPVIWSQFAKEPATTPTVKLVLQRKKVEWHEDRL